MTPPPAECDPEFRSRTARLILHDARWLLGLTQREVAERSGKTQALVSAYESGRRAPTIPALEHLLRSIGLRLEWRVSYDAAGDSRLRGPVGQLLREHGVEIIESLASQGFTNPRVVGPVARARERVGIDTTEILVDSIEPATIQRLWSAAGALMNWLPGDVRVSTTDFASEMLAWYDDEDPIPLAGPPSALP